MTEEARKILEKCFCVNDFNALTQDEKKVLLSLCAEKKLSKGNRFLGRTETVRYEVFDLPRALTCPGKTPICERGCYQVGVEKMHKKEGRDSAIVCSRKLNWFYSLQEEFTEQIVKKLNALRPKVNQEVRVRIHASGDFYSREYMEKWFVICLAMKYLTMEKHNKNITFTAYTKSLEMLDALLSDQNKLKELMEQACKISQHPYKEPEELGLKDFNIHIIGSVMDDTKDKDIAIMEKYGLPKNIVTESTEGELMNCKETTCAECSKCYRIPMEDVRTGLRK